MLRFFKQSCVWLVYSIVVGTPLFYLAESVYPYTVSKTLFFQILVELLVVAWCGLIITDSRYRPRFTPALWGVSVFIGSLLLAAFFGVDPVRSFWSVQDRMFGVFALIHLAFLAFLVSNLKGIIEEKKVFLASLGTACFVVFLGILQLWNPNLLLNEPVGNRPGATLGNPSFLAGYLVIHIIWLLYYLLKTKSGSNEWWLLSAAGVFMGVGMLNAQTRGDIIGLIVGLLVLTALFAWHPPVEKGAFARRKTYLIVLAIILFGSVGFFMTRTSSLWNGLPGIQRFRTLSLDSADLQPRLAALRIAWEGFKERPILGWGPENFNIVFNKNYDPKTLEFGYQETRFDKPHNYLLEFLVTGGVVLFAAYIGLLISFLYIVWRGEDRLWAEIATAMIVGHVVATSFIFETLGATLLFYLILGFSSQRYLGPLATPPHQKPDKHQKFPQKTSTGMMIGGYTLATVALVPVFFVNIPTMRASYYQYQGFTTFKNRPDEGIANFKKAISLSGPYRWNLERDYAAAISEAYFYNSDKVPQEEVKAALTSMERLASEHPLDAYNYYALVDMYNQVSDIDPKEYTAKAEAAGAKALELSPNRQQVIFSLAKTKSIEGDNKAALELIQKGIDLAPKVPDGHFYYGLISYANGDAKHGYESIEQAITLGREWKNANEPLAVANFFADSGHLDEAVKLYEKAKEMQPDSLEIRIKLGIAYYMHRDFDLAREEIRYVTERTDLASNPRYGDLLPILRALGLQ